MTPFKKLTCLALTRDIDDHGPVLEIAPTMRNITHDGKRYFRLNDTRRLLDDGRECAVYLWDGWADMRMKQIKAEKEDATP